MDGYTDVCNDVGFSSTSKGKPSLSNENAMSEFCQTFYVGSGGHKYYPRGLLSPNVHIWYLICIIYLFRLANNKKVKYLELCIGYIDETWYVASDGHKYYLCDLLSPNMHI